MRTLATLLLAHLLAAAAPAVAQPDLTVTKTHVGNFAQGQTGAQYSITVHNAGTNAVLAGDTVTVVDTLPVGLTATALSGLGWTCTLATVSCINNLSLAAGASYFPITLTVSVAGSAGSPLINTVTVSGGGESNTGNDTATDSTIILPPPDLTVSKIPASTFTQGRPGAQYTITVSNAAGVGSVTAGNTVTVVDSLPVGLTATAMSGPGWTCVVATVSCTTNLPLAAGAQYFEITLTVSVASDAGNPLVNSVTVSGGGETNTANDTATVSTTILAPPDLTVSKTPVGTFAQGQTGAQYTISVSNIGPSVVLTGDTVTVVDSLPTGLTATGMSGIGWTCTLATVSCINNNPLGPGVSYFPITLTVSVAGNASSPLLNTVTVSGGGETNTANDTATHSTIILGPPDLSVTKTHAGNFAQGQPAAQYTILVSNAVGVGVVTTGNTVTVVDTLPAGLTATAMSGPGWTCTLATVSCVNNTSLAAGASYFPITLTVSVAGTAGSPLINSVTVSGGGETNTSNDTATDSTIVVGAPDLTVSKSHVGNFVQGQIGAQYTIAVHNGGASAVLAGNTVTVVDTLPAGLTATAMSGTGWTCVVATVSCTTNGGLGAGLNYSPITLTVSVATSAGSPLINSVAVSGGGETNTANNTATDSTTVLVAPDLSISKTHVGNFVQGQTGAQYNVTVTNAGGQPVVGGNTVTVVDSLPGGLTATGLSGTGWTCVVATVTCTTTNGLAAGLSYPVITLTVSVAGNAGSPLVNTVTVTGGGDVNAANNTAMDSTIVALSPPALQGAVSRKVHGAAGTFDLPLGIDVSNPATEPRRGPAHSIALTFDKVITGAAVAITEGTGVASTPTLSGNQVIVDLTGVTDQQYVTIVLSNVASSDGGVGGSGTVRIGFLAGDVNQSRVVTVADVGLVNAQLAQVVTAANYLKDVNATGTLTVADKGIANASLTRSLPAP